MGYTQVALEDKILHMYPEILRTGITPRLSFDGSRNAWVINFVKGSKSATVFLDKKDADSCMDGIVGIAAKGRQDITTRRRPFRSAFKSRGW